MILTRFPALGHDKAQNIIDQITSAYESGGGPPPGGFSFGPPPPLGPFNSGGPPPGYGAPVPGFPGGRSLILSDTLKVLMVYLRPPAVPTRSSRNAFPSSSPSGYATRSNAYILY